MANLANLIQPFSDFTTVEQVPLPRQSAFPTPPSALGFSTDVEWEEIRSGLAAPYYIYGATTPEGDYTEPTIGQIWPR